MSRRHGTREMEHEAGYGLCSMFRFACSILLLAVLLLPTMAVAATSLEQQPLQRSQSPQTADAASTAPSSQGIGMTRLGLSLAAVVGLILLMRWGGAKLFKGQGSPHSSGVMQVVARSPIAPRQQLMLVRIGRRLVVVANSGGQMTSLAQITDADEVAELMGQLKRDKSPVAERFTSMFQRAEGDFQPTDSASDAESATPEDSNSPAAMSAELGKLLEKVRGMARQFR